ncbi:MAG: sensor histidine kinase [bacterium]|nr:sensor histidine kinase [bacterium]
MSGFAIGALIVMTMLPARDLGAEPRFPDQRVLLINSYHPQYSWTAELVAGVRTGMEELIPPEHLYIEFMDGRRFVDDPVYQERLVRLLRHKYRVYEPDVIISSDDYAFHFLLRNRDALFPGTPVVFCGVNVFDSALLAGRSGFTGILEGMDIAGNVDLIQKLQPNTRRLVLLSDRTTFGKRMAAEARRIRDAREARRVSGKSGPAAGAGEIPTIEIWDDFTLQELQDRAAAATADTVFLMLAIHKDRNGDYFSFDEHLPELAERSPVPIYGMWGALLIGNGVVGGMMNDPRQHGGAAAQMAGEILGGADPDDLPIVPKAEYRPHFDYRLLRKFHIPERRLPADSTVYHRPESFYAQYRLIVNSTIAVILTLMIIIALLFMNVRIRKQAELDLKKANANLEDRVSERTADLHHANHELTKKNRALLELSRQKNQLVGMAAHDLRNPLGVIRGYGEFILKDGENLSENQRTFLKRIHDSSDFMLTLVEDLLDFSRVTAGVLDLHKVEVTLPDLLSSIASLNRILAEKKNIQIEERYAPDLPRILVDPGKLEQVINNLISNAVKYSEPDTGIQISADRREDVVRIAVRDQGQGIPEAELGTLFEPFVRASVQGTAGEKSTGLGLAIVKNIVEGHGGRIEVESAVNQGSQFTVTLPV